MNSDCSSDEGDSQNRYTQIRFAPTRHQNFIVDANEIGLDVTRKNRMCSDSESENSDSPPEKKKKKTISSKYDRSKKIIELFENDPCYEHAAKTVLIFDIDGTLLSEEEDEDMVLIGDAINVLLIAQCLRFQIGIWTAAKKAHLENFIRLVNEAGDYKIKFKFKKAGLSNGTKSCGDVRKFFKPYAPFMLIDNTEKILKNSGFDYNVDIRSFISGTPELICTQQLFTVIFSHIKNWYNYTENKTT